MSDTPLKDRIWDTGFAHENRPRVYCPICLHPLAKHEDWIGRCLETDCKCKGEDWNAGYQ